ncbi:MAG TPA: heterodisulfide reductase-related iron-sulfur binding cluster [Tepidisphaeraceae bacterium]|nr:heterodisulfide reductase-related iron-sulfur binding cluster [Tepidisphaeraceae bacterium]
MSSSAPSLSGLEPALALDPRTYQRALSCVHCGLCLPACPTYTETGHEADSPRGRIQLMRGLADGRIEATPTVKHHLDLCLDCRACETACPSGVVYHELIEETRARFAEEERLTLQGRLMRWIFFNVFVHPTRLKLALLPARVMQKIGVYGFLRKVGLFKLLPSQLRKMEQMLPGEGKLWPRALPERTHSAGPACGAAHQRVSIRDAASAPHATEIKTVGFFAGCIGSVMFEKVNRQAVELLVASDVDVLAPHDQTCCGAIHHHNGAHRPAEEMARRNIDTFLPEGRPGVDAIATNIAGCGAMLREYDLLLRDDPAYAERAKEFTRRVRDISEVLVDVKLPEMKHAINATVTYHDACHLAHAQKVVTQPRALLARVPGLKLVPLPESDMCCGAAGTYNLQHPQMASQLAERKLNNIATTGASVCVTGNVGCAMQIQSEGHARGRHLKVLHPVELLHAAAFGSSDCGRNTFLGSS